MNITIKTIPHKDQPYNTVGWYSDHDNDNILIAVSDLGDWRYNILVALHELVELSLARYASVPNDVITKFDLWWNEHHNDLDHACNVSGLPCPEPGHCLQAPYRKEHRFAESIERATAWVLGVNWEEYCKRVQEVEDGYNHNA